jgi:hypothetical protein
MKFLIACVLLGCFASAYADDNLQDFDFNLEEGEARTLNISNTATALTLLGALILLGVIAYLIYAGGLLGDSGSGGGYGYGYGYNRNDYYEGADPNQYAQYRSNNEGYDFTSSLNIIQWISMLQELYDKFDYNDLECQKRLICEVMKEPDYYGSVAEKFKAGFQYAKYLEVLSLPDDMRELLDEYMDANSRAETSKECNEYFQCPYSIKESFKNNVSGNSL